MSWAWRRTRAVSSAPPRNTAAPGRAEAFAEIQEKIRDTTAELLDRPREAPGAGLTPRGIAEQMAHERLGKALALRRSF